MRRKSEGLSGECRKLNRIVCLERKKLRKDKKKLKGRGKKMKNG